MADNMTHCTNCQREIAASNFVTHSLHCQRNLTKCEKCGEAVPRSGLEEHHAEFHAMVACPDCNIKIERPQVDNHKATSCRMRQQSCRYCELEMSVSGMPEHENYCGSRTKKCEDCGEYVMLKYEQLHLDSNHTFLKLDDEPGPTATWIKNDISGSKPSSVKNNNSRKPQLYTGKFEDEEEDSVAEIDRMLADLAQRDSLKKQQKVWAPPRHPGVAYPLTGGPQRTISRSPTRSHSVEDNMADLVALPCEFCEAMIPSDQLLIHQTACRPDITCMEKPSVQSKHSKMVNLLPKNLQVSVSESDSFIDVEGDSDSDIEVLTGVQQKKTQVSRQSLTEENKLKFDDEMVTDLPCEFCGDGYPPSLLLEHQDVCEFHPRHWNDSPPLRRETAVPRRARKQNNMERMLSQHNNENPNIGVIDILDDDDDDDDVGPENSGVGPGSSGVTHLSNRGNVASEWNDIHVIRPSAATGAIPKQKAGKLNIRQIPQETSSSRPTNNTVMAHRARNNVAGGSQSSNRTLPQRANEKSPIRNNLHENDGNQ